MAIKFLQILMVVAILTLVSCVANQTERNYDENVGVYITKKFEEKKTQFFVEVPRYMSVSSDCDEEFLKTHQSYKFGEGGDSYYCELLQVSFSSLDEGDVTRANCLCHYN